jgi:catechol 2,3-dioxygenase-like lactoylglutathione lyase family enzyme
MIDHTGIKIADVERSAAFYDAALGALGLAGLSSFPGSGGPMPSAIASITPSTEPFTHMA